MKAGRKTKLTAELQSAIINAVSVGVSLTVAAQYVGVEAATVLEWKARGEDRHARRCTAQFAEFAEAVTCARAKNEVRLLARLEQAGRGGAVVYRKTTTYADGRVTTEERVAPPDWQADAWVLERSRPEQWGRTAKVDVRLTIERAARVVADECGLTVEEVLNEAQKLLREADDERP